LVLEALGQQGLQITLLATTLFLHLLHLLAAAQVQENQLETEDQAAVGLPIRAAQVLLIKVSLGEMLMPAAALVVVGRLRQDKVLPVSLWEGMAALALHLLLPAVQ
jgi:hypothetical protein